MTSKEKSTTAVESSDVKKPKSQVFTIERLRQNCLDLFGVTVSTFDGATHNLTGLFTVEEMKAKIKVWQEKPIFVNKKKGGR